MARKPSKALQSVRSSKRARTTKPTPEVEAQQEPQPELLALPLPLLFAAELVSAKDDPRPGLQTVFAHRKGNAVRLVATDGTRMFISSFKPGKETILPSWLEKGVMISTDALRPRLNLLRQLEGASVAMLRYTVDQPTAILADANERSMFRIGIDTHNKFPEYRNVLREESFGGTLDDEGNIAGGGEWQAVGFNSTYLRHVNDIAKALSAGLSKHEKERGMVAAGLSGRAHSAAGVRFLGMARCDPDRDAAPFARVFKRGRGDPFTGHERQDRGAESARDGLHAR